MGFRSTFCVQDYAVQWPEWFRSKYDSSIYIPSSGAISAKCEMKTYGAWSDLESDIQKALIEDGDFFKGFPKYDISFVLCYLHECGGITRIEIHKDRIIRTIPHRWNEMEGIGHSYCSGCSDAEYAINQQSEEEIQRQWQDLREGEQRVFSVGAKQFCVTRVRVQ